MNFVKSMMYAAVLFSNSLQAYTYTDPLSGNNVAVWSKYTVTGYDILASVQTAGVWTSEVNIGSPTVIETDPVGGINDTGNAVAAWLGIDPITGYQVVYASVRPIFTGVWSTPTMLSVPSTEYVIGSLTASIASSSNKIVITWESYFFSTGTNVQRGTSSTLSSWGAPQSISTP